MTSFIGDAPAKWIIRVTRGCDRVFTVIRNDDAGDPLDWDADVFIDVDVTATPPVRVAATVTGPDAEFLLSSDVCDMVNSSTQWRVIMSTPSGVDTFDTAVMVGTFERDDGYRP